MPEISRFFGITSQCSLMNITRPTSIARYGEYKMEVAIETLSVLAGMFPPRALGLVMEWAALHREELQEDWELARKRSELKKISPLE